MYAVVRLLHLSLEKSLGWQGSDLVTIILGVLTADEQNLYIKNIFSRASSSATTKHTRAYVESALQ